MARIPEKKIAGLDELIIRDFNKHTLPGLAVGVVQSGKLVYARGFGMANIEQEKPVTPDTVFRIGSISKTFTAVAIMQLMEQGKLHIDDPVNQHLKSHQVLHGDPGAPPVTIRHMLTHVSGIGEMRSLADLLAPVGGLGVKPEQPPVTQSEFYKGRLTPELYPGEKWAYANHAFNTLGQVVEDVSGVPFARYMLEHVFTPLGMDKSDFLLSERVRSELAQGYNWKQDHFKKVPYMRIEVPAAGSIFSSVNQMTLYTAALMNGGANSHGRILKPETLEQMFTSQLDMDERIFKMGLAYFLLTGFGEHRVIEHSGGWDGFISEMLVAPDDKLAVIVFTNSGSMAPYPIADHILKYLLELPEEQELPMPGLLEMPHQWPALCGFYGPKPGLLTNFRTWGMLGNEIEVYVKNNRLMARGLIGPSAKGLEIYRCDPKDPNLYRSILDLEGSKFALNMAFKTDEQGKVERIEANFLVIPLVLYKRPMQKSIRFRLTAIGSLLGSALLALGWLFVRRKPGKKC
jgi:CubicO group peptidase (beta-lactamase class C family)